MLTKWDEIYNCIAILARYVKDLAKTQDYIDFTSNEVGPPDSFICLDALAGKKLKDVLYNESGSILLNESNIFRAVNIIKLATDELLKKGNIHEILVFFQVLDKSLADNILAESRKEELDDSYYLNMNVEETQIGILPYFHCGWELSSERINRSHGINVFVDNYMIVDLSALKNLQIINHYLDSNILPMNKKKIRVGVSPLWNWINFEAKKEVENGRKVINISYNSDSAKETDIVYQTIEKAAEEKVDILVFPEMHGNAEMKNILRNRMLKAKFDYPKLVVLPSYWNEGENIASIIEKHGIGVIEQGKRIAFIDKDDYHENLKSYDELHVMHIKGLGRIIVIICRDFLEVKELAAVFDEIRPTLVLVPSFSTGFHDFDAVKGIGEAHECVMVWVNSCADSKAGDPVGFVDRAGHSYNADEERMQLFYPCDAKKNSQNGCKSCCNCDINICLYTADLINSKFVQGEDAYV